MTKPNSWLSREQLLLLLNAYLDNELDAASIRGYTFEHLPTEFPGARADLTVFDAPGNLVLRGRDYQTGGPSFWRPSRVGDQLRVS